MPDQQPDNTPKDGMSRRTFLKNTGLVAGGVVGGSLLGGLFTNQIKEKPADTQTAQSSGNLQDARMFFSRKEDFDILSAATERIYPADDIGPGAIELGVPYFIDKQLNGEWGMNAKEYTKGPFFNEYVQGAQDKGRSQDNQGPNTEVQQPNPTPRYQTRLRRNEIFVLGLREMDHVAQTEFGSRFIELDGEQQDKVLQLFEEGKVKMRGYSSKDFFHLLRQLTIEGAYADPLYGGNKDMMGWKMKEYPGPRATYMPQIEAEEFIVMDQESLKDYQKNA